MRVVQIVSSFESRHGGPSVSVPALAAGLARIGHDVDLVATGPAGNQGRAEPRLTVQTFPRDWPQAFAPSAGMRRYLSKIEVDVLHSHGLWLRPLHYAHRRSQASRTPHVISPRA